MSLQAYKDLEMKINQQLYNNIFILTLTYPPSDKFKSVFKKDMFLKNNKAAFHQVIYYLLHVLDPIKLKEKVSAWPIYEVKMEAQFRNEVLSYLNEINSLYEDSFIPHIMPSHLISPSGFKFVKFMLKVSELVLLKHLQRDPKIKERLLLPIKPSSNEEVTKERIKNLNIISENINKKTLEKMKEFQEHFSVAKEEANKIISQIDEANKKLCDLRKEFEKVQQEIKKELPCFSSEEGYNNEMIELKRMLNEIENIYTRFKNCTELIDELSKGSNILEYNKDDFVPPKRSNHFLTKPEVLNFEDLVNAFADHLDHFRLTLKPLSKDLIDKSTVECQTLLEKMNFLNSDLLEVHSKLMVLSEQINEIALEEESQNIEKQKGSEEDSLLAIPLESSSDNIL